MSRVTFRPSADFQRQATEVLAGQKQLIAARLTSADIQHIGSTAIPDSVTKGDVDIVVRVAQGDFAVATEFLRTIYDVNQIENWTDSFASFKDKSTLGIDFGVQLVVVDSTVDDFHSLRDVLNNNPMLIDEYNAMKLRYEGQDMAEYRRAKASFFQRLRDELRHDI